MAGELSDCVNEFKTKGIKTLRVFNFFANNKQVKETDADIKYQNNIHYKKQTKKQNNKHVQIDLYTIHFL